MLVPVSKASHHFKTKSKRLLFLESPVHFTRRTTKTRKATLKNPICFEIAHAIFLNQVELEQETWTQNLSIRRPEKMSNTDEYDFEGRSVAFLQTHQTEMAYLKIAYRSAPLKHNLPLKAWNS